MFCSLSNMDYKPSLLVFITLLIGSFAFPTPGDDNMSIFFDHTDASARVVGGTQVAPGSHPHMAAMIIGKKTKIFLCGGSLITQRTVLTAAHCIDAVYWWSEGMINSFRVAVGSNKFRSGTEYEVARYVNHPDYNQFFIKHDIGVLITTTNVALNNLVQLVPITYDHIGGGVEAIFAGWGATAVDGKASRELLEMKTSTLDGIGCMRRVARAALLLNMPYFVPHIDPRIEICTLQPAGLGLCGGDSGSALRRASDGHQFGIASWGFHCALGAPDMYVRVSAYQNWLRSVVV